MAFAAGVSLPTITMALAILTIIGIADRNPARPAHGRIAVCIALGLGLCILLQSSRGFYRSAWSHRPHTFLLECTVCHHQPYRPLICEARLRLAGSAGDVEEKCCCLEKVLLSILKASMAPPAPMILARPRRPARVPDMLY